ncbi:hypothetical protein ACFSQ3_03970 [Sphingobacterium corticis]|uniref:Glycosyltransferase family 1 protein n=1 Tax=Sphingobacterium corticis TaxID=1812823 RepID=A0ABW5NG09_9SPHI
MAEELRKYDSFDYALFVRPDMFPLSFVESVREKTACMSAYQWDGLSRYNEVNLYIEKFDRFFVFDETDLSDNLLPLTNFCAGSLYPSVSGSNEIEKSAFFLSSYDPARFRQSIELKRLLEMHKIKCEFIFVSSKRNKKQDKEIQINGFGVLRKEISYLENIRNVVNADIIIDICVEGHQGLSFRVFESLSLSKKLITTNSSIKQYDFYHPNNIFVWDGSNAKDLSDFLEKPIFVVQSQIRNKYTFLNWIKYVFDFGSYKEINLPKNVQSQINAGK